MGRDAAHSKSPTAMYLKNWSAKQYKFEPDCATTQGPDAADLTLSSRDSVIIHNPRRRTMLKASTARVLGVSFSLIGVMFEWYYLAYNWTGGALGRPWYRVRNSIFFN